MYVDHLLISIGVFKSCRTSNFLLGKLVNKYELEYVLRYGTFHLLKNKHKDSGKNSGDFGHVQISSLTTNFFQGSARQIFLGKLKALYWSSNSPSISVHRRI